jgi:hypothetical protein
MASRSLGTYLNNHLAGSVGALELLQQLKDEDAGTKDGAVLAALYAEISAERQALEDLMAQLGITTSATRQASAWLTEKLTEVKLRLDDPDGQALRRFEALEALSLGITGKTALWNALAIASATAPELGRRDYARLIAQSERQFALVEGLRREAAGEALGGAT